MMRKLIVMLSLLGVVCTPLFAQTLKSYEKAANEAFQDKDYYSSVKFLQIVLDVKDDRIDLWHQYAESARKFGAFHLAEQGYQKVVDSQAKKDYPLAIYWLALMKKNVGKYQEAKDLFQRYLLEVDPEDYYYKLAHKEVRSCDWAIYITDNPNEELEIRHLDQKINTPHSEFGPLEMDGSIYYSSLQFVPKVADGEPAPKLSRLLTAAPDQTGMTWEFTRVDSFSNVAHTTFSADGQKLYFNFCDYISASELTCEIYTSTRLPNQRWSSPVKLPSYINLPGYTSTQPNIGWDFTANKEVLYFSSDRPGGKGKMDIWFAYIDEPGEVQHPQNLSAINTEENDITPFFHTPSQVLYFSSDGYQTLGGYDIFKAIKRAAVWTPAQHMDYPTNSSYNDVYYSLSENSTKALFASNRPGSAYIDKVMETCCNDIYEVIYEEIVIEMVLSAYDRKYGFPLDGVTVEMNNLTQRNTTWVQNPDSSLFEFPLSRDNDYQIIARRAGYIPDTLQFGTAGFTRSQIIKEDVYLNPLDIELLALIYDDETGASLPGAKVEFRDSKNTNIEWKRNFNGNDFSFPLLPGHDYILIASKEGYIDDTISLSSLSFGDQPGTIIKKLHLSRKPSTISTLEDYLPLSLYFDNDMPEPDSRSESTALGYDQTFDAFYGKKDLFKDQYGKSLTGSAKTKAEEKIEYFFEEEVRLNFENLDGFCFHLHNYLQEGQSATLLIKGYASPLADDHYNENLSKRRTASFKNLLLQCEDGLLVPYLENGLLVIKELPFGESTAPSGISDQVTDKRGAIYSIEASKERRIEIIEIKGASALK